MTCFCGCTIVAVIGIMQNPKPKLCSDQGYL